ncbi:transposase [Streptomyces sp. NBC_01304]|uniref:transposase n=1 Tax=Streptomyces sp. NBC_01304 TaxID=2903818 RepID=UPI002E1123BB|nr:DDE-type integrase/transposase/recombinase [Streptomyces sp. NBC_01304]
MKWQVIALAGQEIRLLGAEGEGEVALAGHLFADPGFAVVGEQVPQAAPQWGLFETAPAAARDKALTWLRHIREVESGLPDGSGSTGTVRSQYAPERFTLAEREQAKAEELTALGYGRVSRTTVQRMRLAYRKQGLWGLVDHRTTRSHSRTGRTDERVVAAVREALGRQRGRSKGTVNALFPVAKRILAARHGAGTVPVPSQATLYRLVTALARPGEMPTSPVRATPSSYEGRAYYPTVALRPGEQVQIDTTRLDVFALFDDGTPARPELTIAVDVASRAILAAVLCPQATKAVDAALLLAEMAVPHPARPTWPDIWRMDRSPLLPHQRLRERDERLEGAAARPVVVPETIVVDRGKVFISRAFTAACETLGISVQPAPPHAPTAKGIVERTFGTINDLFCQHLPGYTGSDVTRRGPDAEGEACYSIAQLQDLLDEWLVAYHHRPHEGLRHPQLALSLEGMHGRPAQCRSVPARTQGGSQRGKVLGIRVISVHGAQKYHHPLTPVDGRGLCHPAPSPFQDQESATAPASTSTTPLAPSPPTENAHDPDARPRTHTGRPGDPHRPVRGREVHAGQHLAHLPGPLA